MTSFGLLVVGVWGFWYYQYDYRRRSRAYDAIIDRTARRHCVDSRLVRAVIMQESGFRLNVRGPCGEVGLMQVRPDTKGATQDWADSHRINKPCPGIVADPEMNIEIGVWYLARALRHWRKYDDCIPLALSEYNAGWSKADTWKPVLYDGKAIERISYRPTRAYVQGILKKYNELKKQKE